MAPGFQIYFLGREITQSGAGASEDTGHGKTISLTSSRHHCPRASLQACVWGLSVNTIFGVIYYKVAVLWGRKKPSNTTGSASKEKDVSFHQTRPDHSSTTWVLGARTQVLRLGGKTISLAVQFPILEQIWVGPRTQSQRNREQHNSWSSWGVLQDLSAYLCQGQDCAFIHTGPILWFPALTEGSFLFI